MDYQLGISIQECTKGKVSLVRTTLESKITITIESGTRRTASVRTGNKFLNHMLVGIASRSCVNLDVEYTPTIAEPLDHVIVEDTGLTLGRAVREMLDARREDGVNERGFYCVAFDEALVTATLAFDGRAYTFLHGKVPGLWQEQVEDILSTSLKQFFDGFAQGAGCAVHLNFLSGEDSHHTWEAAFKAFGEALREALEPCSFRAGATIGLKGTGMEGKL